MTDMSANRWKYFRWTPRTAWLTVAYVVVVPAFFGYIGFITDVSYYHLPSNYKTIGGWEIGKVVEMKRLDKGDEKCEKRWGIVRKC